MNVKQISCCLTVSLFLILSVTSSVQAASYNQPAAITFGKEGGKYEENIAVVLTYQITNTKAGDNYVEIGIPSFMVMDPIGKIENIQITIGKTQRTYSKTEVAQNVTVKFGYFLSIKLPVTIPSDGTEVSITIHAKALGLDIISVFSIIKTRKLDGTAVLACTIFLDSIAEGMGESIPDDVPITYRLDIEKELKSLEDIYDTENIVVKENLTVEGAAEGKRFINVPLSGMSTTPPNDKKNITITVTRKPSPPLEMLPILQLALIVTQVSLGGYLTFEAAPILFKKKPKEKLVEEIKKEELLVPEIKPIAPPVEEKVIEPVVKEEEKILEEKMKELEALKKVIEELKKKAEKKKEEEVVEEEGLY